MNIQEEFGHIKHRTTDDVLKIMLIFVTIGLLLIVYQTGTYGWQLQNLLYLALLVSYTLVFWFRKKIPYLVKTSFMVFTFYLFGFFTLHYISLAGGIALFITATVMAALLLGRMQGILALVISMLSIAFVGYLHIAGLLEARADSNANLHESSVWIYLTTSYLFYSVVLIYTIGALHKFLLNYIRKNQKLAEKFRKSKEEFQEILKTLPMPMGILNGDKIEFINEKFISVLGYQLDEIPDMTTWTQKAYPDVTYRIAAVDRWEKNIMNIKQKEFTKPESPYLITDSWGVERPFELYYKIWNDKVLILFNDMSEIVQREDALKRSEEKYKLLFNKSNDAILLHSLEDNALGRFIEVNEEAQKRYNYSLEEFKMLTPLDITTVKHIKFIPEVIGQLKETGEIVFETVHISSDQRQIQVEVNAHLFYYNFKQYILSIVRDIGQRKEAESELKNYQQYLEKLVKERTDEVNQVNEELMQSNEQLHLANQKLNTKNLALESTYEEMKATNEELYYKNSMLQQTLTELKMTQSKLIQSEKMASIGVLTAGIAHEINNPINFISSSVQGLNTILEQIEAVNQHYAELNADNFRTKIAEIDRFKEEVDYRENLSYLPDIMKSLSTGVDRTVEIIKGLRLFSRIDKEEKRQMDINENMDASITLLKNKYKNKIRIVRRYGKIEPVNCLVGRINQVFMNLLSNAIDAILSKTELSNDETITVKTWQDSQFTYISVADTGPGIKSTIQSRIFEPFFSTKEVGKGTGMGLSISLSIIEQHNGKLELIKSNEKGTEFQISIPNF